MQQEHSVNCFECVCVQQRVCVTVAVHVYRSVVVVIQCREMGCVVRGVSGSSVGMQGAVQQDGEAR